MAGHSSTQLMDTTYSAITTKTGTDSTGCDAGVEGGQVPSEKTFKLYHRLSSNFKTISSKNVSSCTISDPVLQNKTRIRVHSQFTTPIVARDGWKFY